VGGVPLDGRLTARTLLQGANLVLGRWLPPKWGPDELETLEEAWAWPAQQWGATSDPTTRAVLLTAGTLIPRFANRFFGPKEAAEAAKQLKKG
jgi:hypothetical protein